MIHLPGLQLFPQRLATNQATPAVAVPAHTQHHVLRRSAIALGGSLAVFGLLNGALLLATHNRLLPFTKVNGHNYGFQSLATVSDQLQSELETAQLSLIINEKSASLPAKSSGISIDTQATIDQLRAQKGWHRVPLLQTASNLFTNTKPTYTVNRSEAASAITPLVPTISEPAQDASITIPATINQAAEIKPHRLGKELNPQIAADQLARQINNKGLEAQISPNILEPKWKTNDYRAIQVRLEAARNASVGISSDDKQYIIDGTALQKMLLVDTSSSELKLTLDQTQLIAYLAQNTQQYYVAPVTTKVNLQDGKEISKVEGTPGKLLDHEKTAAIVTKAFESGTWISTPIFTSITPEKSYTRRFTTTDQELYGIIDTYAKNHPGSVFKVAVVELTDTNPRSAFYGADDSIVPASTYKLFIAYATMQKIEQGEWTLQSPTSHGTVDHCIRRMIIVSDDVCAKALQDKMGWAWLDEYLAANGFAGTAINNKDNGADKHTTARNELELLTRMYYLENVSQTSRDYLFDIMDQQIYWQGIQAGSRGSKVVNKVGMWSIYNSDAAIVYAPKTTYALVVLTENTYFLEHIRQLSVQIFDYYNR